MDLNFNSFGDIPASIRYFIIAAVCAIIFYFAYMLDFSGLQRVIKNNQQKENDLKTQFSALITVEALADSALSHLPQLQETLKAWQGELIKPSQLPDLLNEILKIGTSNNLQFDLFNPGEGLKVDQYIKIPIRVIIKGNYDQIANFISQVANMKWLVGITNFSIEKKADLDKKTVDPALLGRLTSELNLEVYYLADK